MKKKILSLIMCIVMLLGVLPVYAFAEDSEPVFKWKYKVISEADKTAALDGVDVRADVGEELDVVLPESLDGYTLIETSDDFRNNTTGYWEPKSMYIPDTYKRIGEGFCFGCDWLESVRLPENLEWIGYGSFDDCTNLFNSVQYDQYRVKYIGEYCIGGYQYRSRDPHPGVVVIKTGTTLIKGQAFSYCKGLKKIILPDTVRTICPGAFIRCNDLNSIVLPDSMTKIEKNAFSTYSLKAIYIPESITCIDDEGICGMPGFTGTSGYSPYLPWLTVYGAKDSAAEEYANKFGLEFIDINEMVYGDVDEDGEITLSDIAHVRGIINESTQADGKAEIVGDMNSDCVIDAFDMFALDKALNGIA